MSNVPVVDHPLEGTTHVYRADAPPYDPALDNEPGYVILGNGWRVIVRRVFHNWNDIEGLTILAVFVPDSGSITHVTPADLGVSA